MGIEQNAKIAAAALSVGAASFIAAKVLTDCCSDRGAHGNATLSFNSTEVTPENDKQFSLFTFNVDQKCPKKKHDRNLIKKILESGKTCSITAIALQEINMTTKHIVVNDRLNVSGIREYDPKHVPLVSNGKTAEEWSLFVHEIFCESHRMFIKVCGGVMLILLVNKGVKVENMQCDLVRFGQLSGVLGNKAAIGFYFELWKEKFVIIGTHLAAHEGESPFERRRKDLDVISRELQFKCADRILPVSEIQNVILMGDLNYRVRVQEGEPPLLNTEGKLKKPDNFGEKFWNGDQLLRKGETYLGEFKEYFNSIPNITTVEKNRVSHFLNAPQDPEREEKLRKIRPTFKYVVGEKDKHNVKRTPSITDRIFYKGPFESVEYEQLLDVTMSDHKPVHEFVKFKGD